MKKFSIFFIVAIILEIVAGLVMCAGMAFGNKSMVEVGILSALAVYGVSLLPRMFIYKGE